jgi:hypothetical protein
LALIFAKMMLGRIRSKIRNIPGVGGEYTPQQSAMAA